MPTNWRDVDPELRQVVARTVNVVSFLTDAFSYKYWLYLAEDANFRMRNRFVSNEQRDPILGDGWGYMVKKDEYYDFLKSSLDVDEVRFIAVV